MRAPSGRCRAQRRNIGSVGAGDLMDHEVRGKPPGSLASLANRITCDIRKFGSNVRPLRGTPQATTDTEKLLRGRLMASALSLLVGFAVFLTVYIDSSFRGGVLMYLHMGLTLVMAVAAYFLRPVFAWKLGYLRAMEYLVFGLPAAYFFYLQWWQVDLYAQHCATTGSTEVFDGLSSRLSIPWITVMFIYASFIPNHWLRCAIHILPMAAAPVLQFVRACLITPGAEHYLHSSSLLECVLWVSVPSMAAIYGAYTFNQLRQRAAYAREFGSYHLQQLLGSGGMGEVYLGEHVLLKRPCAIKLIRPSQAADPRAISRFENEVRATASLTHWNTIEIYDYGLTEDGTFYYAMEFLPGMNLQELVDLHGPMPVERAIHLLRQVCDGLNEAHEMGLIHRDIKPGNIFATHRGAIWDVAKLLDFGLVKLVGPAADESTDGLILGTPLFAAPEWATTAGKLDARSDIYSLGAVGYFLVTGRPLYLHRSPVKVLFAHATEPIPSMRESHQDIPTDFEAVIMRCLAKRPEDRFQSVRDLGLALDACKASRSWTQARAKQWWQQADGVGQTIVESDPSAITQALDIVEMSA